MESDCFQVGAWRADPTLNQLQRRGETRKIEPRVMDLLVFLVRHAGQVVSRTQILDEVWEGAHVGDEALTYAVTSLRKALGDDSRQPTYVATVPKRGYRLVAPVAEIGSAGGQRRVPLLAGLASAAVVTVVVVGFAIWPQPLEVEIEFFRRGGTGEVPLGAASVLFPGNALFADLRASEDVFVYVINEDLHGRRYVLFPADSGLDQDNPLPGGQSVRLPGTAAGDEVLWQVTSAGGRERFIVVVAPKRLTSLEEELANIRRAQFDEPVQEGTDRMRGVGGLTTGQTAQEDGYQVDGSLGELLEQLKARDGAVVEIFSFGSGLSGEGGTE